MNYLPYQQRVVDEKSELDIKLNALGAFLLTHIYKGLPLTEKKLLRKQASAMKAYSDALGQRILGWSA